MKTTEFLVAVRRSVIEFTRLSQYATLKPSFAGYVEVSNLFPGAITSFGNLHDHISDKPWADQCKIISDVCGPSVHTIRLMALAWAMYDGWIAYMQKHKHAPVDVEQYLIDAMSADDMTIVLEKEY